MSMSDDTNERTADEIAQDVETNRARVTETLDELKARMSPGQLLDEVMAYGKGTGSDILSIAGRAARDNPLPVLLVGAGLALFAFSRDGGDGSRRARRGGDDRDDASYGRGGFGREERDDVFDTASAMASSVRDTASAGMESAREGLARVGEAVSDAAGSVGEMAGSLYRRTTGTGETVGETVSHATDKARRMLHHRGEDVAQFGSRTRRRVRDALEEQPLAVAAIGLAIGAALGALLPRSRTEDELMGDAAERTRETARHMAEAGYRQARDVVEDTMRHVTDELSERGLSTDAVREAAAAAAEKARRAAMGSAERGQGDRSGMGRGASQGPGREDYGSGRATGGEGYVPPRPPTGSPEPAGANAGRAQNEQEGPGGRQRTPGEASRGAPAARPGPVL